MVALARQPVSGAGWSIAGRRTSRAWREWAGVDQGLEQGAGQGVVENHLAQSGENLVGGDKLTVV